NSLSSEDRIKIIVAAVGAIIAIIGGVVTGILKFIGESFVGILKAILKRIFKQEPSADQTPQQLAQQSQQITVNVQAAQPYPLQTSLVERVSPATQLSPAPPPSSSTAL